MLEMLILVSVIIIVLAVVCKPIRKAFGLLFIIIGIIECLSMFFIVIGIVSILIGGILLFV